MKTIYVVMMTLAMLAGFAGNQAQAEAMAACPGPSPEPLQLHYPAAEAAKAVSGAITSTIRKGVRCFKTGDVLPLVDPTNAAKVYGSVKVLSVEFTNFAGLTTRMTAGEGLSVAEAQAQLLSFYGDAIKTSDLTVIYFHAN